MKQKIFKFIFGIALLSAFIYISVTSAVKEKIVISSLVESQGQYFSKKISEIIRNCNKDVTVLINDIKYNCNNLNKIDLKIVSDNTLRLNIYSTTIEDAINLNQYTLDMFSKITGQKLKIVAEFSPYSYYLYGSRSTLFIFSILISILIFILIFTINKLLVTVKFK